MPMKMLRSALFIPLLTIVFPIVGCAEPQPPNLLANPGFEERKENGKVAVWLAKRHAGEEAYNFGLDTKVAYAGKQSYRIEQYAEQVYGMVRQAVQLPHTDGQRFIFSAMLKTQDIKDGDGWRLTVNCRSETGFIIQQFRSEPVNGTTDWQKIVIEEDIPEGTVRIDPGVILQSLGTGWVDDAYLGIE